MPSMTVGTLQRSPYGMRRRFCNRAGNRNKHGTSLLTDAQTHRAVPLRKRPKYLRDQGRRPRFRDWRAGGLGVIGWRQEHRLRHCCEGSSAVAYCGAVICCRAFRSPLVNAWYDFAATSRVGFTAIVFSIRSALPCRFVGVNALAILRGSKPFILSFSLPSMPPADG